VIRESEDLPDGRWHIGTWKYPMDR